MTEFIVNHLDGIVCGLVIIAITSFVGVLCNVLHKRDNTKYMFFTFWCGMLCIFAVACLLVVCDVREKNIIETTIEEYNLELIRYDYNYATSFYETFVLDDDNNYFMVYLLEDEDGDYVVYTYSDGIYSQLEEAE